MHKVGYSFWGYLGDIKYTPHNKPASTPDGNAFYSWCIIRELQKRNYDVIQVMPDRDFNSSLQNFTAFAKDDRVFAYQSTDKIQYLSVGNDINSYGVKNLSPSQIFNLWNDVGLNKCDFILHEWRMKIPGRNLLEDIDNSDWQPDLYLQELLIEYCELNNIQLVIFDLDYKLTDEDISKFGNNVRIIELGTKLQELYPKIAYKVYIPFDFSHMEDFDINKICSKNLVYVGNRYERDWAITKYIPSELKDVIIYGNWLESNRDSKEKWPYINFGGRIQPGQIHYAYEDTVATLLLAKDEYCKYGFMTARLLECLYYGCVPLFIIEYSKDVIHEYADFYSQELTVKNKLDVIDMVYNLKYDSIYRYHIIEYLREYLEFMDVKYFIDKILNEVLK